MRELIYKDEAYKAIDNCIRDGWYRISPSEAKMNICHLVSDVNETGRPQGEWIPCSERLPEEKEVVAVIIKQWDTGEVKKGITYRVDRNMWVGFGRHNEACVWWLPLPPWKGADDDSNNE